MVKGKLLCEGSGISIWVRTIVYFSSLYLDRKFTRSLTWLMLIMNLVLYSFCPSRTLIFTILLNLSWFYLKFRMVWSTNESVWVDLDSWFNKNLISKRTDPLFLELSQIKILNLTKTSILKVPDMGRMW